MYRITNASFTYNTEHKNDVLTGIDLTIPDGQVVLICGESGSGKTSLIRLLNGLIPHYYEGELTGQVLLQDVDLANVDLQELAPDVGTVFQNPKTQFFTLNSSSEISFGCENMGVQKEEIIRRVHYVVEMLKLEKLQDRNLFEMSGGEKQKIACACVSAMETLNIILDEPSSNLDTQSCEDLRHTIKAWKKQGKTIVIAEHRLVYLMDIVDRVICMKEGRIIYDAPVEEFAKLSIKHLHSMGLRANRPVLFNHNYSKGKISGYISIESLHFSYPGSDTGMIDMSNIDLPQNEVIGVIGYNGAGKSTFAKCLCGLEKKMKGAICYKGKWYTSKTLKSICYMVFQDVNHQLFAGSVKDELLLSLPKKEKESDRSNRLVEETLASLNLLDKEERHPMSLSGGERQRVAIASALVTNKEIIIFDEPTSGLDYNHMVKVANNLMYLKEQGKSVFVITHDPELINLCCTYLIFVESGKIKWHSSINEECSDYMNKVFFTD